MGYAFGMRFDTDSNATTFIDEENQTANTKGYINGEYVEFRDNPNRVEIITGTALNPFGDGNRDYYVNLAQAIQNKNATVIVHMNTEQILGMALDMYIDSTGTAVFDSRYAVLESDDTNYVAFDGHWNRLENTYYLHAVSKALGFVDGSAYAGTIQTVTTIIWHPLT